MSRLILFALAGFSLFAQSLPRHTFHPAGWLTPPSPAPARTVAHNYTRSAALAAGLVETDLAGLYVAREYRTDHNGVTHFVYRQRFQGVDVYNVEWTVNVDRDGQVINAGGSLAAAAAAGISAPIPSGAPAAFHAAIRAMRPNTEADAQGERVWFSVNGRLRPAWLFFVPGEEGADNFATIVDNETHQVLRTDNLTWYQSAPRGMVFERESPQPNPEPGTQSTAPRPYVQRTLQSFAGDPVASPKGWVSNGSTAGNNVIVGENSLGIDFSSSSLLTLAPTGDFSFPLDLGPGAPNPMGFRDAANTNLFYWTNRTHDLFYQLGFDEQAGNYQQDNGSRGGVGGDPMLAYTHFGAAGSGSASMNNAFYTTMRPEDGVGSSINMFIGGRNPVFTDGAYDAQVIVHEYTHGVSLRLVRLLRNYQGSAMSEAFSDFFSLEFLLPDGAPADGIYPVGEYLIQQFGVGGRTRPYTTRTDVNPLTYANIGHVTNGFEVHADGEIWVEALWDVRANLIQQFGEKEGRRRIRLLVIDGMKLSPPTPSMVDMRDAILLADQVDFKGASQDQIWTAFAKRGLGALAMSDTAESRHIAASFDKPSPKGSMRFFETGYVMGETARVVLQDANYTRPTVNIQLVTGSGDLENLVLRRTGSVYYSEMPTYSYNGATRYNAMLDVIPNDGLSAYYVDLDTGQGASEMIRATASVSPEYAKEYEKKGKYPKISDEQPLYTIPPGNTYFGFGTSITLPFQFPFFDKKYTTARLYSDGLVAFDLPNPSPCKDAAALSMVNGIAPLWLDLAYGGTAQDGENIYVSSTPDTVTIRWAAETQPIRVAAMFKPKPVNFSLTLYRDGQIRADYGSGNVDLMDSAVLSNAYGCAVSAPTVGLSNGHETYADVPFVSGQVALEALSSFYFYPPFGFSSFPVVKIEKPAANDTVQGVLTLHGIAYDSTSFISRLDVLIDGVAKGFTDPRKQAFEENLNVVDLKLAPGAHTLVVRATTARGAIVDFPDQPIPFTVAAGQNRAPVGNVEKPAGGDSLSGIVTVSGFVYAPDLTVNAVDIVVDGVTYGRATYNQKRDDVCGGLSPAPPNCPRAGFTYSLNTRSGPVMLPNGTHTLQVRALDEAGRFTLIPETPLNVTVNNPVTAAPMGVLAAPQPNAVVTGTIQVSGYAWSPDSRVTSVSILVDSATAGSLIYGFSRPTECATLPDIAACPNIGFAGSLDTRRFSNGPHALGVSVRDVNGNSILIPALIRNGMNVTVQN